MRNKFCNSLNFFFHTFILDAFINAEKIYFTGNKLTDKKYYKHTGYPGGIKMQTPENILASLVTKDYIKRKF